MSFEIDPRNAPIHVVELELDGDRADARLRAPGRPDAPEPHPVGHVMALVRVHGHPVGLVGAELESADDAPATLTAAAYRELADAIETAAAMPVHDPLPNRDAPPLISVVIATREHPGILARALDSALALDYPRFEVIVVDNDPPSDATETMVRERFGEKVVYVREPVRGLASAHNRGAATARGQIVAFTDDDVLIDRGWLTALADAFASADDVACVTGLIVPAELRTRTQALLEWHGKATKGFTRRAANLGAAGVDRLFPYTAGELGAGANMAFTAKLLRELGGFDPAMGVGSATLGGDDLMAFFLAIATGHTLVYEPDALIWHHHHTDERALIAQARGHAVGLGAFLTGVALHHPRMLPLLAARLPRAAGHALRHFHTRSDTAATSSAAATAEDPVSLPPAALTAERRGLLYGPFAYLRSTRTVRRARAAAAREPVDRISTASPTEGRR
jgi:O-antigen biosynthesis protein